VQAFRAGDIDMLLPSAQQYGDLMAEEGFADEYNCMSYWNPAVPFFYICWNNDNPLFADKRVRRAMTHILDRDKIVSSLLKGNGQVVTGPFYHKSKACDASIEPWPYDPEKARQLLDEAGWVDTNGNGIRDKGGIEFSFKFTMPGSNTLSNRLGKLLKDSAAKVGIEVIIDPVEWSILMTKVNDRQFEAVTMGCSGHILHDPHRLWHSSQIGNRGANYSGFSNATADAIIEQARRTLEEDKRAELYRQLHGILHEEQPFTFLYTRPTFRIVNKRFKNVKIYPLGLNYFEWFVPISNQKYGAN
jgi:peptide/nickel transport system substrate-binding protein